MKKLIITILGIITSHSLYSQTGSRFPLKPEAIWIMQYNDVYQDIFEYFIDEDTSINSHIYYKLYKSGVAQYETPFYYDHIYVGAIRDEDNKIYYIDKDDALETQLFDFDLELGDTIQSLIGKGKVIDSIDTLSDGRRRYRDAICIVECPLIQLIEGIGHAGGIMKDPPIIHIGLAGYNLLCYLENDILIYHNNLGLEDARCGDQSFITDDYLNDPIKVYPVPATNTLTLEFMSLQNSNTYFQLFNEQGIIISSEIFEQRRDLNNKVTIDVSNFNRGLYFIKVYSKNLSFTKKIIIEK